MLDLSRDLTDQKLAVELEQQLERLVKDGDPLLVDLKRMATTVDGMPMAGRTVASGSTEEIEVAPPVRERAAAATVPSLF
jgi:hypothetical protein